MARKSIVSVAVSLDLYKRDDAHLLLTKPQKLGWDVEVIRFASRLALEKFNEKANLNAVVKTQVPLGCVLYRHQSDSDDRAKWDKDGFVTLQS